MFCDVVGSASLGERIDPEALHDVMRSYQATCARVIEAHRGHVAQYLGDGILVYFGFPQADENEAQLAIDAGLAIVEELRGLNEALEDERVRLRVRVGIHTGPVVVGKAGEHDSDARRQVFGHTINLAARLQETAEPDTVVTTAATLNLVQGLFVTAALGPLPLEGISHPVSVHRVLRRSGMRSRLDALSAGLTRLIGRDHEIALLLDRWEQATEGRGQVVLLSGDAGIGKSRLLLTLRERLPEPHAWLEGRCAPFKQNSAFLPIVGLLEQSLLFADDDSLDEKSKKLERALKQSALPVAEAFPLFASLLSLPVSEEASLRSISPEAQRRRTLELLSAWLLGLGERQPAVLAVEDLHWVDPSTLELLTALVEQVPPSPIFLVLTFRTGFEAPWARRSHVIHLNLHPLTRAQIAAMVAEVARGRVLPQAVIKEIVSKTDGVPLFVEELTKMVIEAMFVREQGGGQGSDQEGVQGRDKEGGQRSDDERPDSHSEFAVPSTLQDSLMARLDRLGAARNTAQLAAVLGREFSYDLLAAISTEDPKELEAALTRLESAELLYRRGVPPRATYIFKHALVQETAYLSLLMKRRREAHERIARVLETSFAERVANRPEEIAFHYEQAGLPDRAASHYQRAGEHATVRSAYAEAAAHQTKAIELLSAVSPSEERDQVELGLQVALGTSLIALKGFGDPMVETAYERARALCRQVGTAPHRFEAVWGLANYYQSRSELDTALDLAKQLIRIAEGADDRQLAVWAHLQHGATLFWKGDAVQSLGHLERSLFLYDSAEEYRYLPGASDPGVAARVYAGMALWQLGSPDQAIRVGSDGVELARRRAHPFSLALALCLTGVVNHLRREYEAVKERAREAVALSTEHDFPLWRGVGKILLGWSMAHMNEQGAAIEQMEEGLKDVAITGADVGQPGCLIILAEAQSKVGQDQDALASVDLGLAIADQKGQHSWDAELLRLRGELIGRSGASAEEGEACFRRALEASRKQESKSLELRTATSLSQLLHARGKTDEARELLRTTYAWFTEGLETHDLKAAESLLRTLG